MTIWKKFKALLSGIEFNRQVPRHPAHLWYCLLTLLSMAAALVMHGDVHFTVLTLFLVIPLGLVVYIPYRYFNILCRMLLNALIFGAGCFWCMYRLKHNVPLDKMLVEALSLWSLTFLTSGKSKGYFYLLFIDILLLLYAALLPRLLSLYLTIGAFGVILILLFRNRTGYLSGDMLLATPRKSFRRTWHFCLLWLIAAALSFHFIFGLIPLTDNGLEGFFPVSFNTSRESFASPELKEWLNSGSSMKNGPDSKEISDNAPGDALALTKDKDGSAKNVQLPKPPPDAPVVPGDGGSKMGNDLVFRVKSPLKLYHLARLYDQYDGRNWRVSPALRRNREKNSSQREKQVVKLSYSLEKIFSASLAIPWKVTSFDPADNEKGRIRYLNHFWGVELKSMPNAMPFKFTAESELHRASVSADKREALSRWPESAPRSAYLALPPGKISLRVQALAKTLTAGLPSAYAKAIALRDFLRSNYTYKLNAEPTPAHRESVDYFLFFLGEGHCEYFASALAVLARCAGLPSRVATGFSPGNYNTLTTLFEVYEYHAHAWTQIYIPEYGWLTFDATPPSAIVSETSPPGLGKMRDPFGDDWRVRPPELTDNTLDYMQKAKMLEERKKQGESNVEQTLNDIASAGDKLREELTKEHSKAQKNISQARQQKKALIDLTAIRLKALQLFKAFQRSLVDLALYIVSSWTRLLAALGGLFLGTALLFGLFRLCKLLCRILRFKLLYRKAHRFADPRTALKNCCHCALALLALHKMPRKNNQELLEYAASLRSDLVPDCRRIFALFYRSEYKSTPPAEADARLAAFHLTQLRSRLRGTHSPTEKEN